jgi:hypothetical protein
MACIYAVICMLLLNVQVRQAVYRAAFSHVAAHAAHVQYAGVGCGCITCMLLLNVQVWHMLTAALCSLTIALRAADVLPRTAEAVVVPHYDACVTHCDKEERITL